MKLKKVVSIITIVAMLISMVSVCLADPTTDFHTGPLPGETQEGERKGPVVEEYMVYEDKKTLAPGSLTGDVDLNTVGRGLFFDGQDFYYFIDTGIMATNFMYTIEGDKFFFGEDGKMVKEQLVSYNGEIYYFDVNGAMYKNRWYSDEAIDDATDQIVYTDYYFGPTGRAYRALDDGTGLIVKVIDGQKFGFNADGEKLEGYYDQNGVMQDPDVDPAYEGCVYYFDPDDNGAAASGWHYYEGAVRGDEYQDNEEIVLYFDERTCKKVAARPSYTEEGRCVSRIIDGNRYMFDSNGVRKNSWYSMEPGRGTNSNARYFNEENDGYLQKGWFTAVPGSYSANGDDLYLEVNKKRHKDDEDRWFYAGKNGNIFRKTIRKIGSYVYAFDDDGVMQEDAFVKVRNGTYIKSYDTDILSRANVLLDPLEYGQADSDPEGPTYHEKLDETKGLLDVSKGERWMYFLGDFGDEAKIGSQAKQNSNVKIELSDAEIYFIQNSIGGYAKADETDSLTGNVTTVVERNNKYIQNGVLLAPNPDNNNYGLVRLKTKKSEYHGTTLNYKNEEISIAGLYFYEFKVVNASGSPVTSSYKAFKDKNNSYIYVAADGDFIGYYPYPGKYYSRAPKGLVDENGNPYTPADASKPCWAYKKEGDKKWTYGLPPQSARYECSSLYINFQENSPLETAGDTDFGPYQYGLASVIYNEVSP